MTYRTFETGPDHRRGHPVNGAALALGLGVLLLGGLAAQQYATRQQERRPADSAPGRTARQRRFGRYAVTGRSVTINRPRREIYDFWRDFGNLAHFMESVESVHSSGDISLWTIAAPMGHAVEVKTRIVQDRPGEEIAWRSTPDSQIDTEGKVMFRDAPGGRGTVVEAVVAYRPPMGELGRIAAKLFQTEPAIQARRDLKRLKMLMETGEIATNRNRNSA
ncbi:SRPBCC family protein (plasmid) [Limimaricola variabilis]|uniref:SRPBCC family protein n=1 Tax=Limimaricola variabilis TaxID=1492771 RepID=UPI002AC8DF5D|nr:SRPBCC family protein [Limimaricola variabilis]WPY96345.1 SRPBCC family protein [Limimaricola variabilis]